MSWAWAVDSRSEIATDWCHSKGKKNPFKWIHTNLSSNSSFYETPAHIVVKDWMQLFPIFSSHNLKCQSAKTEKQT